MKHITIVIPTRNRWDRLRKALGSCIGEPNVDVIVACDGDLETFEKLLRLRAHNLVAINLDGHRGATASRNEVMHIVGDGLLYATDDIVFQPRSIQRALERFNIAFPDDDGVVGFAQDQAHHPSGVALMGKTFRERYPEGKPFCPEYWHFACQEIEWLASKLKKFVYAADAVVAHASPNQFKELMDQTHKDARLHKERDMRLKAQRKQAGQIWGWS